MKRTVEKYISELLFLHDCVIIPRFGGFITRKRPAKLNSTTGTLLPPSKHILFNSKLTNNDGLLISHIASQEEISQDSAKKNVETFSKESSEKLANSMALRITNIGLLTLGKEGNIIFSQDEKINYSLDEFGLASTTQRPIKREEKLEQEITSTIAAVKSTRTNTSFLLRAAAVIIPLVAISYLSISHEEKINTVYSQMATLNPFSKAEKVEVNPLMTPEKENEIITESIESKKDIVVPHASSNQKHTYYIIAGAFVEPRNANNMLKKLNRWEYDAEIVEGDNLLRVSYSTFDNRSEAILALNKIKQENPAAWLLKK